MTRVPGPSLDQLDRLGDDYASLVAEALIEAASDGFELGDLAGGVENLTVVRASWQALVHETLLPALGVAFEVGAATIRVGLRDATGLTAAAFTDVAPTSDALAEQYLAQARNRLVGVGDELWSHAREELLEGLQAGESVPELAARVRNAAPDLTEPRASVIARTEVLGAVNAGALEQVLASGATGTKQWIAADDERTRHTHDLADNDTVGLSEHFTVGGFPMARPHDPAGPPQETISCRCALSFDLDLDSGGPAGSPAEPPGTPPLTPEADRTPEVNHQRDRSFLARVFGDGLAALVGWFKARTAAATLPADEHAFEGDAVMVEHFRSRMITEGLSTGLRTFAEGALTWREPPFALRWQEQEPESGGHGNAVHVGNVTRAERQQDRQLWGYGPLDLDDETALRFALKLARGFIRWVSVGLDEQPVDVEVVFADDSGATPDMLMSPPEPTQYIFHAGRIAELTAVTVPAQAEAFIEPTPELLAELASRGLLKPAEAVAASATDLDDYRPPAGWFAPLGLQEPTGIVVTDDGQVYGHAATFDSCHIGFGEVDCVSPPFEADHPYFLTGEVVTADGGRVPVGQITLATGHAPLSYGAQRAAEHYDDTGSVVADVTCGNDEHGIWVAGAVRPGTDPGRIHELRASGQLSGDWRRIGGHLRLVALLAVNVPGFPVPRPRARVASGSAQALVAAGKVDHDAGQGRADLSAVKQRIAASIKRDSRSRREAVAARVKARG